MPAKELEPTGLARGAVDPASADARGEFLCPEPPLTECVFPEKPASSEWLDTWNDDRVYGICGPMPDTKT